MLGKSYLSTNITSCKSECSRLEGRLPYAIEGPCIWKWLTFFQKSSFIRWWAIIDGIFIWNDEKNRRSTSKEIDLNLSTSNCWRNIHKQHHQSIQDSVIRDLLSSRKNQRERRCIFSQFAIWFQKAGLEVWLFQNSRKGLGSVWYRWI